MLTKTQSAMILGGGIMALINTITFIFFAGFLKEWFFIIIFYSIHSLFTILAGYLLLKEKYLGKSFLLLSILMFILALFIPVTFEDIGGNLITRFLFSFTIFSSFVAVFALLIYVPIFTTFFIYSVFNGLISLMRGSSKDKKKSLKNNLKYKSMKKNYLFLLIIPLVFLGYTVFTQAANLAENLKGRILLQVEENGEAWYVSPENLKRYFLGRPDDAFNVMREQGIGITNSDLAKIPVSLDYLSGPDTSGDGLPDDFKIALGLDVNSTDSDGDGFCDFTELLHGYDPLGPGRLNHDLNFAQSQAGRILLQVEQNGEAWYVSPENNKRYFLGRPADAFSIMRNLGLGISNENLERIEVKDGESVLVPLEFIECGYIDYHEMILSMTSGDKSYWEDKTYSASKTALYCINDAMIKCQAAVFRVQSTDENPAFPSDDDFSVPEMFLIIKGEENSNMCRINNCLIPKEAILNHYNYKGDNFIFTLVGFSPQLEGSKVENNDLYDPVTNEVYKGVCPVGQGIFTSNIVIPEELIIEEKEQSISHRKTSDIKQIQTALQLYFDANNEYPNDLNDLGSLLKPIPIAPTPADCVNNDYIYTAFSDETGLNTKYCLRYCLSQDISIFSAGDPIYATHEHVNTGSICPFN